MNTSGRPVPDLSEYNENRWKFPLEEQEKYAGLQVAFSLDGKRIVASGANRQILQQELIKQNLRSDQVVISYIDGPPGSEADEWASFDSHQDMAIETNSLPPPDIRDYSENRRHFPLEELAKYAGLHVAFSPDGKHILASGPDRQAVRQELRKRGIHPSQVVHSYVDPL